MEQSPRDESASAAAARDYGLWRASALTRWIGVGAVALIGALAGFVAQAKPGRSSTTSQHQTGGVPSGSQPDASVSPGGSSAGATPLAPPPAPPAPAPSSSGIVSGGS